MFGLFFSLFSIPKISRATTMLIEFFTPIFYSIKAKNSGSIPDRLINDSFFISYMTGTINVVLEPQGIKDDFAKLNVLSQFTDEFFPAGTNITGSSGQNSPSNPIFLEAQKLAYNKIPTALTNMALTNSALKNKNINI